MKKYLPYLLFTLMISCGTKEDIFIPCDNLTIKLSELEYADCGGSNGNLTVFAAGGNEPYKYRINDNEFQQSNVFTELEPQYYTIVVEDAKGCQDSVKTFIGGVQAVKAIALHTPSGCGGANGSLEIIAKNGIEPYRYQIGEIADYTYENTFTNLSSGQYSVWVKDERDCFLGIYPVILSGIKTDFVMPFFKENCSSTSCHGANQQPDLSNSDVVESTYESILSISKSSSHYHEELATSKLDSLICWAKDLELRNL